MPGNDDLFAGFQVGNKIVAGANPVTINEKNEAVDNSDLFDGMQIGRDIISKAELSPFPEGRDVTRAAQELPELGGGGLLHGEDKAKIAAIAPVLLATTAPEEVADILTSNFENIGISQDPGGNLLAANNKTGSQVIINRPGLSKQDLMQFLGIASAFTPAGRVAAGAGGLAAKVGLGALTGGATQTGIEVAQQAAGGQVDAGEIGLATATGGASEAVLPAAKALLRGRSKGLQNVGADVLEETIDRVKPAMDAQSGVKGVTGIDVPLFQAQQTLNPTALIKQRLIPQLDAGAVKATKALEQQNKQSFDAVMSMIDTIAPSSSVSTGAKRLRTAATMAVDAGKERRAAATRGLYDEAMSAGADVNLSPVRSVINKALQDAPEGGKFARDINKVSQLIEKSDGSTASLRQLQKAKFEIDEMIEGSMESSLGRTTKRDVVEIKKALVDQMEIASPLYKDANEEFARLSPAVKDLEDSIIGTVSKSKDVALKNVSKRLFDATESNPEVIKDARKVIEAVDPGAWDDIMRVEFQRRVGGLTTLAEDMPGEMAGNLPGQLRRALFGNPAQRSTLLAGMTKEQRKNFVYLDEVLRRASAGRAAGSPTVPFAEVVKELRGTAGVIRDAIFRPLAATKELGEDALLNKNISKLADVMFNPKWQPTMRQLRSVNPQSKKAADIMEKLINTAKPTAQTISEEE